MSLPTIGIKVEFDYGHRLQRHLGLCKNIHGHRGQVFFVISSSSLFVPTHMIADFGVVKEITKSYLDLHFDHALLLEESDPLVKVLADQDLKLAILPKPPTAEFLAQDIFEKVHPLLPAPLILKSVQFYETPNCWSTYTG